MKRKSLRWLPENSPMRNNFKEYLTRKKQQFGDKFDTSALSGQFIPYYESQQRIEILNSDGTKRGYVGVTTGWKPSFILLSRRDSVSSSYLLSDTNKIIKTIQK